MGIRIGTGIGPVRVSTGVGSGKGCGTTIVVLLLMGIAVWVWPLAVGGFLAYVAFTAASSDDGESSGKGCLTVFGLIFIVGALVGQVVWMVHLSGGGDPESSAPTTTAEIDSRTLEQPQPGSADLSGWIAKSAGAPTVVASAGRLLDDIYVAASEDQVLAAQLGCQQIEGDARELEALSGPGQPEQWDDFIRHIDLMVAACLNSDMGVTLIEHDNAISALQGMSAEVNSLN